MGNPPDEIAREAAAWLELPGGVAELQALLRRLLFLYAAREEEAERAEGLLAPLLPLLVRERAGLDALARALEPHLAAFAGDARNHTRVVHMLEAMLPVHARSDTNSPRVAALLSEIVPVYLSREVNERLFAPVVAELLPRYALRRSEHARFAPILLQLVEAFSDRPESSGFVDRVLEALLPRLSDRPETRARLRDAILRPAFELLAEESVRSAYPDELEALCARVVRERGVGEGAPSSFASLAVELVDWHGRVEGEGDRFVPLLADIVADHARQGGHDPALAPLAEAVLRGYCAREANEEQVACWLTDLLPTFARWEWGVDTPLRRHFEPWQRAGFQLLPTHHYSPVPEAREVARALPKQSELVGIEMHTEEQLAFLRDVCPRFREEYEAWPADAAQAGIGGFHFGNGTFESVDAELLHCVLRHLRPRRMVEVGAGWSTLVATQACLQNWEETGEACDLRAIEPWPNEILLRPVPGLTELVREPVQEVDPALFFALEEGDVLFIDSTHVLRMGSDVALLYLEILPRLSPGVWIHIHDVFLPAEYPARWVQEEHVFWNEQYLVQAFLSFNRAFEVRLAASFLHHRHPEALAKVFPRYDPERTTPGSLWIHRTS